MADCEGEAHRAWPDLVGKPFEEAKAAILKDNPDLQVLKAAPGQPMSRNFNTERVFVMVDDNDVVTAKPAIG